MANNPRAAIATLVIVTALVAPPAAAANQQWVELVPSAPGAQPEVTIEETEAGLVVSLELFGFHAEEISHEEGTFVSLSIPAAGLTGEEGQPYMPFKAILLPVPNGPRVEISAITSTPARALEGIRVWPRQSPNPECGSGEPEFVMDQSAYSKDTLFPSAVARIADELTVRGQRFVVLELSPLQYNPATGVVLVHPTIEVRLETSGQVDMAAETMKARRAKSFFATSTDLESGIEGRWEFTPTGMEYVIITHDDFLTAIEPLAQWKRLKGYTVEVVPVSVVGANSTAIKSWLQTRYDSDPDLTYVLLVGDHQQVPSQDVGGMVTDLYYSCLDGSDYMPDIVLGRISVQTAVDCANIVDKILAFDRYPDSSSWHGDFLMASLLQD